MSAIPLLNELSENTCKQPELLLQNSGKRKIKLNKKVKKKEREAWGWPSS